MDKFLYNLLSIQTQTFHCEEMQKFIRLYHPDAVEDKAGNLYVTKGDGPYPCAVAHMDTVHDYKKPIIPTLINEHYVIGINPDTLNQTGIGGDDKCGVYCALMLLHWLPNMKAAFFVDEERGCMGSAKAELEFFKDCRFVLQADRRGREDFVNDIGGKLSSKAFQDAVKPYMDARGFKFSDGAMTDVQELRNNGVGISCANMSAGYYRPHSYDEYIILPHLENTLGLMHDICKGLTKKYPFEHKKTKYHWRQSYTPYTPPATYAPARSSPSENSTIWQGAKWDDALQTWVKGDRMWERATGYWVEIPKPGETKEAKPAGVINGDEAKKFSRDMFHKWYQGEAVTVDEGVAGEILELFDEEQEKVDQENLAEEEETRLVLASHWEAWDNWS